MLQYRARSVFQWRHSLAFPPSHLGAVGYLAHSPLLQLDLFLWLTPRSCHRPPGETRPVSCSRWAGRCHLSQMARTSVPLWHLDMSAMSVTPILLRDVSRSLSMVHSLEVKLALPHTDHSAFSGIVSSTR
ncbi:hypothetical protein J3R82DRAFT_8449 [Butyriboletus roseoflavus]|nr:hypothetical protein J3R82DRAFT_8449 [Butyriboletus roseoflavus]